VPAALAQRAHSSAAADAPSAANGAGGDGALALRRRVTARGMRIGSSLPKGTLSWVPYLLKRVLRDMLRQTPLSAGGHGFSVFLDAEGCLLTCGSENTEYGGQLLLGHDWGTDDNPDDPRSIGPPTLVPSICRTYAS